VTAANLKAEMRLLDVATGGGDTDEAIGLNTSVESESASAQAVTV